MKMLNLIDENKLTEEEKKELYTLRYDGKRYTAIMPDYRYIIAERRNANFDDIKEVFAYIQKAYMESIKEHPSLVTAIEEEDDDVQFGIYDNLSQELIEISLTEINKVVLISSILGNISFDSIIVRSENA